MAAPSDSLISFDFISISHDAPVSKVLSALQKTKGVPLVVVNGGDYEGIVSPSGLLRNVDVSKAKVSTVVRTAPSISRNISLDDAVRLMHDADVRVLPVVESEKVMGVVSAKSVLSALSKSPVFSKVPASELCTPRPVTISLSENMGKAVQLMKEKKVQKLVVVDAKNNPQGVLKLEEIAEKMVFSLDRNSRDAFKLGASSSSISKSSPFNVSVKSMMDENLVVVSPEEKASTVLKRLSEQNNPLVLVRGKGIITPRNVLRFYLSHVSPQKTSVSITHLPDIDEIDRAFVNETLQRTFSKIERTLKSDHSMNAVFKQVQKDGLRAKTTVKISIQGAGRTLRAEASDWKVRLALKEACRALENEVFKRFRSRDSPRKAAV